MIAISNFLKKLPLSKNRSNRKIQNFGTIACQQKLMIQAPF
jgi:hypothetical protein